jgi:hypothetical protein
MSKKTTKDIREQVEAHVADLFPDCLVEWTGAKSRSAMSGGTFGFQLKDRTTGRYHCNIVWINPDYGGKISAKWVKNAVKRSNG